MSQVPVIRLPVTEVDRHLLWQVMNKLKGTHDRDLDAEEFRAIIELGAEDDLKFFVSLSDENLDGYLIEESLIQLATPCLAFGI